MDALGHYLRIHLTGAASGIALFGRGEAHRDEEARTVLAQIRRELVAERRRLLWIADLTGSSPAPLATVVAAVGERLSRLKPNGNPLVRGPLDDLIDLETMRIALSGKIAGWESLLTASDTVDALPAREIQELLDQALRQLEQVSALHVAAAGRALAPRAG